jgi:LacI family transcriptional regulator
VSPRLPKTRRGLPTLAEVAERAGVARSTASRILNGYTVGFSVADSVRERVLTVASELGYQANPVLRSLKAKRTMLVQIVNLSLPTFYTSDDAVSGVSALTWALQEAGYSVCGRFNIHDIARELERDLAPDVRVDGVAVIGVSDRARLRRLDDLGIPYVSLNGEAGPGGIAVKTNETLGMNLVMKHLCERGHRRILYVSSSNGVHRHGSTLHSSVELREHAFRAYCQTNALPLLPGSDDHAQTVDDVLALARGQRATAIVTYSHLHALEIHRACLADSTTGYPERLALACFNDQAPIDSTTPGITAVRIPFADMGHRSADLLVQAMQGGETQASHVGRSETMDPTLTIRESTKCIPSGLS